MISRFVKNMDRLQLFHEKTSKTISHKILFGNMQKYQDSTTVLVHGHIVHTS